MSGSSMRTLPDSITSRAAGCNRRPKSRGLWNGTRAQQSSDPEAKVIEVVEHQAVVDVRLTCTPSGRSECEQAEMIVPADNEVIESMRTMHNSLT